MKTYVGDEHGDVQGPGGARRRQTAPTARPIGAPCAPRRADAVELPGDRDARRTARAASSISPAGFDAAYYLYAYPYQRLALAQRHRLGRRRARRRWRSKRPMCVHATLMRQTQGRRAAGRPPVQRPEHHRPPRPAGRRRAAARRDRADPRHPRHLRPPLPLHAPAPGAGRTGVASHSLRSRHKRRRAEVGSARNGGGGVGVDGPRRPSPIATASVKARSQGPAAAHPIATARGAGFLRASCRQGK